MPPSSFRRLATLTLAGLAYCAEGQCYKGNSCDTATELFENNCNINENQCSKNGCSPSVWCPNGVGGGGPSPPPPPPPPPPSPEILDCSDYPIQFGSFEYDHVNDLTIFHYLVGCAPGAPHDISHWNLANRDFEDGDVEICWDQDLGMSTMTGGTWEIGTDGQAHRWGPPGTPMAGELIEGIKWDVSGNFGCPITRTFNIALKGYIEKCAGEYVVKASNAYAYCPIDIPCCGDPGMGPPTSPAATTTNAGSTLLTTAATTTNAGSTLVTTATTPPPPTTTNAGPPSPPGGGPPSPGPPPILDCDEYDIVLLNSSYDAALASTIFYYNVSCQKLTSNKVQGISHWNLADEDWTEAEVEACFDLDDGESMPTGKWDVGKDGEKHRWPVVPPATEGARINGIKWDGGFECPNSEVYKIVLEGDISTCDGQYVVKAGQGYAFCEVQVPCCGDPPVTKSTTSSSTSTTTSTTESTISSSTSTMTSATTKSSSSSSTTTSTTTSICPSGLLTAVIDFEGLDVGYQPTKLCFTRGISSFDSTLDDSVCIDLETTGENAGAMIFDAACGGPVDGTDRSGCTGGDQKPENRTKVKADTDLFNPVQGNVLILQRDGNVSRSGKLKNNVFPLSLPDDDWDGGTFKFIFNTSSFMEKFTKVFVASSVLLDIDQGKVRFHAYSAGGGQEKAVSDLTEDGGIQTVQLDFEDVLVLEVVLRRDGALGDIALCLDPRTTTSTSTSTTTSTTTTMYTCPSGLDPVVIDFENVVGGSGQLCFTAGLTAMAATFPDTLCIAFDSAAPVINGALALPPAQCATFAFVAPPEFLAKFTSVFVASASVSVDKPVMSPVTFMTDSGAAAASDPVLHGIRTQVVDLKFETVEVLTVCSPPPGPAVYVVALDDILLCLGRETSSTTSTTTSTVTTTVSSSTSTSTSTVTDGLAANIEDRESSSTSTTTSTAPICPAGFVSASLDFEGLATGSQPSELCFGKKGISSEEITLPNTTCIDLATDGENSGAMIFDAACGGPADGTDDSGCGGGDQKPDERSKIRRDTDLFHPQEGKVLILQRDGNVSRSGKLKNNPFPSSLPDDDTDGGCFFFTFNTSSFAGAFESVSITDSVLLDIEERQAVRFTAFIEGGRIRRKRSGTTEEGGIQTVALDFQNVEVLHACFPGSGALGKIDLCLRATDGTRRLEEEAASTLEAHESFEEYHITII